MYSNLASPAELSLQEPVASKPSSLSLSASPLGTPDHHLQEPCALANPRWLHPSPTCLNKTEIRSNPAWDRVLAQARTDPHHQLFLC